MRNENIILKKIGKEVIYTFTQRARFAGSSLSAVSAVREFERLRLVRIQCFFELDTLFLWWRTDSIVIAAFDCLFRRCPAAILLTASTRTQRKEYITEIPITQIRV